VSAIFQPMAVNGNIRCRYITVFHNSSCNISPSRYTTCNVHFLETLRTVTGEEFHSTSVITIGLKRHIFISLPVEKCSLILSVR
jgi:hypothetical protein